MTATHTHTESTSGRFAKDQLRAFVERVDGPPDGANDAGDLGVPDFLERNPDGSLRHPGPLRSPEGVHATGPP